MDVLSLCLYVGFLSPAIIDRAERRTNESVSASVHRGSKRLQLNGVAPGWPPCICFVHEPTRFFACGQLKLRPVLFPPYISHQFFNRRTDCLGIPAVIPTRCRARLSRWQGNGDLDDPKSKINEVLEDGAEVEVCRDQDHCGKRIEGEAVGDTFFLQVNVPSILRPSLRPHLSIPFQPLVNMGEVCTAGAT